MLKAAILSGVGVGMLTEIDILKENSSGELVFVPLNDRKIPLSVLSLVSLSGRTLSVSAALMVQHLSTAMLSQPAPSI
jgi:DNA-binding transcriptional LysR family regulator